MEDNMVYFNLASGTESGAKKDGQKGQGMTEYILIVLLVAIALIAAFGIFRDKLIKGVHTASDQIENVTTQSTQNSGQ
jgi:Flp pilus assembly pilin Flp